MPRPISRFTPSLMSHQELERLYVPRNGLLDKIARRIEKAAGSGTRNHTLLVGGRGSGKTHTVSLAYHRATNRLDELDVQLAWLDEDPWLILSFDELLAHILDRLEPQARDRSEPPRQDLGYEIRQRAETGGPIVVFAENFDQILEQIGRHGQQQLRHLLETHRSLLLVATTTNLAHHALQAQSAPFYGFLTEERLEPFRRYQAAAMLTNIATLNGNQELAVYLREPASAGRLAVVEHLAGGTPRLWATLGTALDIDGLDDLVDHLMATIDDLTPYYQEQLARLSGHQRRVVAGLGRLDRPMSTVALADELGIDQRSLSKTLHELKDRGWVKACDSRFIGLLDGRSTYYELAEPLARLAFQVKANRGEPLRLIVDFLKGWYQGADLRGAITATDLSAGYIEAALDALASDIELAGARSLVGATTRPAASDYTDETAPQVLDALLACDRALEALDAGNAAPYFALSAPLRGALESIETIDGADADISILELRFLVHIHALLVAATTPSRVADNACAAWLEQSSSLTRNDNQLAAGATALSHGWRAMALPVTEISTRLRNVEMRGLVASVDWRTIVHLYSRLASLVAEAVATHHFIDSLAESQREHRLVPIAIDQASQRLDTIAAVMSHVDALLEAAKHQVSGSNTSQLESLSRMTSLALKAAGHVQNELELVRRT